MRWVLLMLAAVAVACTIQTIFPYGTGPQAGTASQQVGAGGGLVAANDGTSVLVPAGALSSTVTVTIGLEPDAAPLTGATSVTTPHAFGPTGQAFARPVCVTLSFEPGQLPQGTTEQNVVLFAQAPEDAGGGYVPLPTFAADPTHVTGMTSTFSTMTAGYGDGTEEISGMDAGCGDANFDAEETSS
jgi:hypothetical protein